MVPHFDRVFDILEGDNPVPQFCGGFPRRKEVLQDLDDALSELCAETFED